ncbi:hypothetical protein OROMI_014895 [Orobanche minor]
MQNQVWSHAKASEIRMADEVKAPPSPEAADAQLFGHLSNLLQQGRYEKSTYSGDHSGSDLSKGLHLQYQHIRQNCDGIFQKKAMHPNYSRKCEQATHE